MKIFVFDFDGTITLNDSTTEVVKRHLPEINAMYRSNLRDGKTTIKKYIQEQIEMLDIDMATYIHDLEKYVQFDITFKDFMALDIPFLIVSSGTLTNVQSVLRYNGIEISDDYVKSNILEYDAKGFKLEFPYPHPANGVDKAGIIKQLQDKGHTVVFVGDSYSDFEAALVADIIYCKKGDRLEMYCIKHNIKYKAFTLVKDIIASLEENAND